jgi:hypothetical protein
MTLVTLGEKLRHISTHRIPHVLADNNDRRMIVVTCENDSQRGGAGGGAVVPKGVADRPSPDNTCRLLRIESRGALTKSDAAATAAKPRL